MLLPIKPGLQWRQGKSRPGPVDDRGEHVTGRPCCLQHQPGVFVEAVSQRRGNRQDFNVRNTDLVE